MRRSVGYYFLLGKLQTARHVDMIDPVAVGLTWKQHEIMGLKAYQDSMLMPFA